ncbi:ABC transporter ATP-binding protein [Tengunoibacter tsumagoiensis]|uniref:ABC transporter ATP-binding protein n=1 Tax=Tengunoibacter tsumagoiensis TaxID=2014871 RepID=A0A402A659_9CHLR|nr:ABC transporter ATP-binding protein [Tengunoibacter tsumagoiensis]GCE14624.1 ABC transporter ATP-binding protein [Tengunoibacter tsumagoiensis]
MERDTFSIRAQNVTKTYKKKPQNEIILANDNLSLNVAQGEIFGLLGPNGAGKTTLLLQLLGLLVPDSGDIQIEGINVVKSPDQVKKITGYMPQSRVAMKNLEVYRALTITGQLRGMSKRDATIQTKEMIERLDLGEHRTQYLDRLSGGMLRAVSLGMALMGHPRILILDEPTNELDPVRRRMIWSTIQQINATDGITFLLVTHNVLEAEQVVEQVAIVDHGRVIASGSPEELKRSIKHDMRIDIVVKAEEVERQGISIIEETLQSISSFVLTKPRHYSLFTEKTALGNIVNHLVLECSSFIDDFRVVPPSLEDVYIHHTNKQIEAHV